VTDLERLAAYEAGDYEQGQALNALLAARHHFKDLVPITQRQKHKFDDAGREWDESPGQLRGRTGWLSAPNYVGNIGDACDLVEYALGKEWIVETQVRTDGSMARLHKFDPPCRKTGWHRGRPGKVGAAAAIVRAVLEATEPKSE